MGISEGSLVRILNLLQLRGTHSDLAVFRVCVCSCGILLHSLGFCTCSARHHSSRTEIQKCETLCGIRFADKNS